MKKLLYTIIIVMSSGALIAQNESLPYDQIPDAPESYTASTVAARMIDGLGFRFYWATFGLTEQDLNYKPSESSRTLAQTIDHVFGLCNMINYSITHKKDENAKPMSELNFSEKRAIILIKLKSVSDILRKAESLDGFSEGYPFWNNINGPISDAIWHTGQLVMMRRASGNPIPKGVNVFNGTKK